MYRELKCIFVNQVHTVWPRKFFGHWKVLSSFSPVCNQCDNILASLLWIRVIKGLNLVLLRRRHAKAKIAFIFINEEMVVLLTIFIVPNSFFGRRHAILLPKTTSPHFSCTCLKDLLNFTLSFSNRVSFVTCLAFEASAPRRCWKTSMGEAWPL